MFSKFLHLIPKNPSSSVSISGGHENDVEVTGFRFFTLPFFVLMGVVILYSANLRQWH